MAISHTATGTRSAGGTTTVSPSYPTGVSADRIAIASRVIGPSSATGTAESGWTQQVSATGGDPAHGAGSADNHSTRIVADTKILAGSESGSVTFDNANSPNTSCAVIQIYQNATGDWDIVSTSGTDDAHATGRTVTGSAIDIASGDVILACVASDNDATTSISSATFSASGITFSAGTIRLGSGGVTTGLDCGLWVMEGVVTAGSGTVAPTVTIVGGPQNCGPVAFIRLRETSSATNINVGVAEENDEGLAVTKTVSYSVGVAEENNEGLAATRTVAYAVGVAEENDEALAATKTTGDTNIAVGVAQETDAALAATVTLSRAVGVAQESDQGLSVSKVVSIPVGIATETDQAPNTVVPMNVPVDIPIEHDLALTVGIVVIPTLFEFKLPSFEIGMDHRVAPTRYFRRTVADSLVRINGVLRTVRTPTHEQLTAAGAEGEDWFMGGRVYAVNSFTRDELVAAGFSVGGQI